MDKYYPEVIVSQVFLTHKHWDHAGEFNGVVKELQNRYSKRGIDIKIGVYSGSEDNMEGVTHQIKGDIELEDIGRDIGLRVNIYKSPCHTKGHILIYIQDTNNDKGMIFTGDTLFVGGCGRFFEGNAE